MSPKPADPAVRAGLIQAAARLLAASGPDALTTRRLAAEVGTSTMAVYTHFGSMDEVRRAVRYEGFTRLAADLKAIPPTQDPVVDLAAAGAAYVANGLRNPEMYRAMFIDRPPQHDDNAGTAVFGQLVEAVRRCIAAGRFHPADPQLSTAWAAEFWTVNHGMVTLALTGLLPIEQIWFLLTDMTYRLVIGFGDDPPAAQRSIPDSAPHLPPWAG